MSLTDRINADIKTAIKNKEKDKLTPLRAVKAAILLALTDGTRKELSEADEIQLLQKLVKQRRESYEIYKEQNREDLAAVEKQELDVIVTYLPQPLSPEEIETIVKGIIEQTGASSMKDMGKVMGMATKQLAGKADGKELATTVRKLLS